MVSDAGNGMAATSSTWAKKNILGFSNDEIMLDNKQQRIEKAMSKENEAPEQVIHTGIFDNLDRRYQKKEEEAAPEGAEGEGAPGEIPGLGGEELGGEVPGMEGGELPELPELTEGSKQQILEDENKYTILNDGSKTLHEDMETMFESIEKVLKSGEEIKIKKIDSSEKDEKEE
jgi:hypothetical protein